MLQHNVFYADSTLGGAEVAQSVVAQWSAKALFVTVKQLPLKSLTSLMRQISIDNCFGSSFGACSNDDIDIFKYVENYLFIDFTFC